MEDHRLVEEAVKGDSAATRLLVRTLLPVIQVRVARVLVRRRGDPTRDIRVEVEDFSQEVFVSLFADEARLLRAWDPTRGLSLVNFCGLIAERETISRLRSGKRSPFTETATDFDALEREAGPAPDAELRISSKEQLALLSDRLREELTPKGLELFYRLIVEEEAVESVCASTGMSADAVYAWRSRLGKLVRKIVAELSESGPWREAASRDSDERGLSDSRQRARKPERTP